VAAHLLGLRVQIPLRAWLSLVAIVCCQVDSLQRADHSSRGVLPNDVCLECDREASMKGGLGLLRAFAHVT
jgi:hypothetical protein